MMITLTVTEIADGQVHFKDDAGAVFIWPKDKLPQDQNLIVGSVLYFHIFPQKDLIKSEKELATQILNEILQTS
jgi:hypothetical protein